MRENETFSRILRIITITNKYQRQMETLPTVYIPCNSLMLPDNDQWQNRFEIRSETSNRVYVIAQHKVKKHWGCSCPSYRTRRYCKHLSAIGVPAYERPYDVIVNSR
jgi:hypothetical protein